MRFRTYSGLVVTVLALQPMLSHAWAVDTSDGQRWWSHVAVLADDKLEGRVTGSAGHRKAAEYVAGEFAAPASSRPGPTATFSQCT